MTDPNSLGFFGWKLLHLKDATYVQRDGCCYVYAGDKKIDMTLTDADDEDRLDEYAADLIARSGEKRSLFDPKRNVTFRGALVVQHQEDGEYYTVAFVQEGSPKKRQIIMLWVASSEKELLKVTPQ